MNVNKGAAIFLVGDKEFFEKHMKHAERVLYEVHGYEGKFGDEPIQVLYSMIKELREEIKTLKEQNQNVRLVSITKVEGTKNE